LHFPRAYIASFEDLLALPRREEIEVVIHLAA
jgi:hypothetical protein